MPSNKTITVTVGASGATYTAPANGYFNFRGRASAAYQWAYIGDTDYNKWGFQRGAVSADDWIVYTLPVLKGATIVINYTTVTNYLYFAYAEGEI